ncbi:hypothetical protein HBN50_07955 [Halobacteriovorax sp. GB3]|uniref:hypothetical protein n=1 Tax=Halobacteriovorax sp. GB3 TaxID=2719615 RepID=UPI002362D671|nr:hypothetical protein [Halobacteriovorax sp. GB3]MDD0853026.1 hypothetical protein [Halobacteriovorax sp. GB3]
MKERNTHQYLLESNLEHRMKFVYLRFNVPGSFDDFFQEYRLTILDGRAKSQTLDQFAIDYLRKKLGRNGERRQESIVLEYFDQQSIEFPLSSIETNKFISSLIGTERALFILRFQFGFTEAEMAHVFSITPSRISQVLNQILKKARKYGS